MPQTQSKSPRSAKDPANAGGGRDCAEKEREMAFTAALKPPCSLQQFLRCAKYTPGSAARWLGTCRGGCELPLNSIYKLRAPCLYVAAGHGTEAVSGTRAGHRGAGKGGGESRRMDSDTAASGIGALRSTRGRVAWPWPSMCVRVQDRVSRSAKPVLHEARQHCKKSYVKSNKCCGLCVTKTYDSTKNL